MSGLDGLPEPEILNPSIHMRMNEPEVQIDRSCNDGAKRYAFRLFPTLEFGGVGRGAVGGEMRSTSGVGEELLREFAVSN